MRCVLAKLLLAVHLISVRSQPFCERNFTGTAGFYSLYVKDDDVFAGQGNGQVRHWKLSKPNFNFQYAASNMVHSLTGSKNQLFVGSNFPSILQFTIGSSTFTKGFAYPSLLRFALAVYGDYLYAGYDDGKIVQWDIRNGEIVKSVNAHAGFVFDFSINSPYLFSVSTDSVVKQWLLSDLSEVNKFTSTSNGYRSVYSVGDYVFAAGGTPFNVFQWKISTKSFVAVFIGHTNVIYSLFVSEDHLFSASHDTSILHWNITTNSLIRNLTGHTNAVLRLTGSGEFLYSASVDLLVKQWRIPDLNAVVPDYSSATNSPLPFGPNDSPVGKIQAYQIVVMVLASVIGTLAGASGTVWCLRNSLRKQKNQFSNILAFPASPISLMGRHSQNLIMARPLSQLLIMARPPQLALPRPQSAGHLITAGSRSNLTSPHPQRSLFSINQMSSDTQGSSDLRTSEQMIAEVPPYVPPPSSSQPPRSPLMKQVMF